MKKEKGRGEKKKRGGRIRTKNEGGEREKGGEEKGGGDANKTTGEGQGGARSVALGLGGVVSGNGEGGEGGKRWGKGGPNRKEGGCWDHCGVARWWGGGGACMFVLFCLSRLCAGLGCGWCFFGALGGLKGGGGGVGCWPVPWVPGPQGCNHPGAVGFAVRLPSCAPCPPRGPPLPVRCRCAPPLLPCCVRGAVGCVLVVCAPAFVPTDSRPCLWGRRAPVPAGFGVCFVPLSCFLVGALLSPLIVGPLVLFPAQHATHPGRARGWSESRAAGVPERD
jgi:hypothetical protein